MTSTPVLAQTDQPSVAALMAEIEAQKQALKAQQAQLDKAEAQLHEQRQLIEATEAQLVGLQARGDAELAQTTARGAAEPAQDGVVVSNAPPSTAAAQSQAPAQQATADNASQAPITPVGEAPPPKQIAEAVLPEGVNVLTRPGHALIDEGISYVQASSNLLVFRGIEIAPAVEVGLIDASTTERNQTVATSTLRYGIWPGFEVEALIPYVYGNDRVTEVVQQDQQTALTRFLRGSGLGDVEFTGRYQLTSGADGGPVVVGNVRVKSATGTGPFDVAYDQFGAARALPTGSGFWAVEPSFSALITSDPAVIFATLGYMHNFGRDVNKEIGTSLIGKVDPGDSIDASFGFAFSLNQRFSFSLGVKDSYIFPTSEIISGAKQRSPSVEVGSLLLGVSYRINDRTTLAGNFEFGVTSDAPNLTMTFHVPVSF